MQLTPITYITTLNINTKCSFLQKKFGNAPYNNINFLQNISIIVLCACHAFLSVSDPDITPLLYRLIIHVKTL